MKIVSKFIGKQSINITVADEVAIKYVMDTEGKEISGSLEMDQVEYPNILAACFGQNMAASEDGIKFDCKMELKSLDLVIKSEDVKCDYHASEVNNEVHMEFAPNELPDLFHCVADAMGISRKFGGHDCEDCDAWEAAKESLERSNTSFNEVEPENSDEISMDDLEKRCSDKSADKSEKVDLDQLAANFHNIVEEGKKALDELKGDAE